MKRCIKTLSSLFLTVFLVIILKPVAALGMEICEVDGILYRLDGFSSTAAVLPKSGRYPDYYQGEIKIPSIVEHNGEGYMVTDIGNGAFFGCGRVTFVELPNTLHKIGDNAFRGCCSLCTLEIPDSVEHIGNSAFRGCVSLRYLFFGECSRLQTVGPWAFGDCWRLCRLRLPESVRAVGENAFARKSHVFATENGTRHPVPPCDLEDDVFYSPEESDLDVTFVVSPCASPAGSTSEPVSADTLRWVLATCAQHQPQQSAAADAVDASAPAVLEVTPCQQPESNQATQPMPSAQPTQEDLEVDLSEFTVIEKDAGSEGEESPVEATFEVVDGTNLEESFEVVENDNSVQPRMSFTPVHYPQRGSEFFLGEHVDDTHFG